jgi:hypothetical protein
MVAWQECGKEETVEEMKGEHSTAVSFKDRGNLTVQSPVTIETQAAGRMVVLLCWIAKRWEGARSGI